MADNTKAIGSAIAGSVIATAMFRTLVEKGMLTPDEATGIMNRAVNAVRNSITAKERAAFDILVDLQRQLHT